MQKVMKVNEFTEYNFLCHHGILGMKWGVRRYQNKDGSLTEDGRKHYSLRQKMNSNAAYKIQKNFEKDNNLEKFRKKAAILLENQSFVDRDLLKVYTSGKKYMKEDKKFSKYEEHIGTKIRNNKKVSPKETAKEEKLMSKLVASEKKYDEDVKKLAEKLFGDPVPKDRDFNGYMFIKRLRPEDVYYILDY